MTGEISFQRMPLPPWDIHLLRSAGDIKKRQLVTEFEGMARLNSSFQSRVEESLDSLMPETQNHLNAIV
jgi:hypothetical protein